MSYFQQSQRNLKFGSQKQKTPSPFQYNSHALSKPVFAKVPFGSTSKLNRSISSCLLNEKKNTSIIQNHNNQVFNDLKSSIIKKQQQKSSAFKSQTQRFKQKDQIFPGPGQYENKSLLNNIPFKKYKNKNYSTHNFIINKYNQTIKVPSIPSDHLGYKQGKANVMQKVVASLNYQPQPGMYQLREQLIKKNGLKWKNIKEKQAKNTQITPGPGYYQIKISQNAKAPLSSFKSTKERFNGNDNKKQKRPGPGYYNPNNLVKKQQDFKMKNECHFSSKTSRFNWMNPSTNIGPGQYLNIDKGKSKSMIQFKKTIDDQFLPLQKSKPLKKTIFYQNNLNPGPGEYANTLGMGFELQKQLLRKYTDSIFSKEKRETFSIKKQTIPGPGTYNFNLNQQNIQKKTNKGLYKKIEVINLKDEDQIKPSPLDYANFNNTIQHKVSQTQNKLTLTESKPFGLGQQRFKHYLISDNQNQNAIKAKQNQNEFSNKKVKKIVMTNIKVNIPFGSSSQKISSRFQQQHTTSDFYIPNEEWVKKSHNIKSKLKIQND